MLKVLDLFSGLGGFSLGLERTGGFETVAFCEIEKFPQKVLAKHWPGVPIYEDVKELTAEKLISDSICKQSSFGGDGKTDEKEGTCRRTQQRRSGGNDSGKHRTYENRKTDRRKLESTGLIGIDVITGGFPCQDISVAGKQKGIRDGERSSLFDEIIRLTRDIRPRYVICENVSALLSGSNGEWFSYVLTEFSRIGYDCEWESISAQEVGAWHKRDRVWIIAYPMGNPKSESNDSGSEFSNPLFKGLQGSKNPRSLGGSWQNINKLIARCSESLSMWESEPSVGRVANGIPAELDIYGGLIYEEEHDKSQNAETLREPRGRLLRVMWEQRETAKTSPDLYRKRLSDCMSEVPHFDSHGGWYLGAWIEENKGLRDLWEEFYSKPFEEAQDLQQELLERIRKIERTKEVGPTKDRSHRLKGLGNAVVPQIPELIGRAILEAER